MGTYGSFWFCFNFLVFVSLITIGVMSVLLSSRKIKDDKYDNELG